MSWQPIETAPKDGSLVLLAGGSWGDEEKQNFSIGVARWRQHTDIFGMWIVAVTETGFSYLFYHNPTHWQPLPSPPES